MWFEVIILCLLILITWLSFKKPSNYPPGLWGVPLFGSLPFSLKEFEDKFEQLRKKHGNIFCWRIGSKLLVFLCDFKSIKEAYNSPIFANRPQIGILTFILDEYDIGMLASNGPHWHNIRRFALRHLRDLGMGKSKIETAVQFEAMEFVKEVKKQAGKPALLPRYLKPAVINVLWQMVASKRYDYDDKFVVEFDNTSNKIAKNFAKFMFLDIFSWVKSVLPKMLLDKLLMRKIHVEMSKTFTKFFEIEIKEHISTLDKDNPRDFIDDYLIEMNKQKLDPNSTMSSRDLTGCITDLFGAGSETTAATIYWSILYLSKFPEIQQKLQKEIDNVLPNESLASLDDKERLPYTEAFINEILRYSTLSSFGIPRTVLNDTTFGGYTIPQDAIVLSATKVLHFDPSYYESPNEFHPERFLNADGKLELPKASFFPFGTGKRVCIGESFARMQLLIFLTTMLKHLNFSAPPNKEIDIRPMEMPMFNQPRVDQEILITIRQ